MSRGKYAPGEKFASREEFFQALDELQTVWDCLANRPQNAAFLLGWPYATLRGAWRKRFMRAIQKEVAV